MKYFIIAGEASGDLHGATLIRELKAMDAEAEFSFFGGDKMQAEAGKPVLHISEMAFMGFVEVVMNITSIFKNIGLAKKAITDFRPDALILIDFPGFNLKIARFAREQGLKVFYYISPKVWAWNQKRVLKIKKVVDHLFCILPFEKDFYREWGMEVDYVGNPLMDAISAHKPDELFKVRHNLSVKPVIALLPGSRKQEISALLPVMAQLPQHFPNHQFVIAGAPGFNDGYYQQFLGHNELPVVYNSTYDLLLNSAAAVVASGTATLETALLKAPEVVVYKGNAISIAIAKLVIKIRFISLVNLIMNAEVVKELIQEDCTVSRISEELKNILGDQMYRQQMLIAFDELRERVGEAGASARTARLIVQYLNKT